MKSSIGVAVGLLLGIAITSFLSPGPPRVVLAGGPSGNGDVNADGKIDIADAIYLLGYLFSQGPAPQPIQSAGGALPATGQILCYNAEVPHESIDCASTEFPGQDGFYRKGCPNEGRFVDDGDGTVTDTCTGLMWQQRVAGGRFTWQEALQYAEDLEFAGHGDWRLPNVRELESIFDYTRSDPSIDPVFQTGSSLLWSSTTNVEFRGNAWRLSLDNSGVYHESKTFAGSVLAVRG